MVFLSLLPSPSELDFPVPLLKTSISEHYILHRAGRFMCAYLLLDVVVGVNSYPGDVEIIQLPTLKSYNKYCQRIFQTPDVDAV